VKQWQYPLHKKQVLPVQGEKVVSSAPLPKDNAQFLQDRECLERRARMHPCFTSNLVSGEPDGSILKHAHNGNVRPRAKHLIKGPVE